MGVARCKSSRRHCGGSKAEVVPRGLFRTNNARGSQEPERIQVPFFPYLLTLALVILFFREYR